MATGTLRSTSWNYARRALGACAATAAFVAATVLVGAAPAHADRPLDLGGAYVLDTAGALGSSTTRVESALDALFDAKGAPLFVVIVDRFEGALDAAAWADETALQSGLGDRDALLAIAIDDREYATSVGVDFPATDAELDDALVDALIPALRDSRWADGIVAYADALRGGAGGAAGGSGIPILPIALGVGGVGVAWFFISRARRKKNPVIADVASQSVAELDQTASRRLVQLDDALTTSEQELGFAEAQFGEAATAGFRTALNEARALVTDAFRTRRELDDENPKAEEQKREGLLSIVAACEKADELLSAQEEAFDALRDVEQDLPAALAAARAELEAAPALIAEADAIVARLRTQYSAAAIASVADGPAQAARLLELAHSELAEAANKQQAGSTADAAIDVRAAQLALTQLAQSAAAAQRLAAELDEAQTAVQAQADDLSSGVTSAASLPPTPELQSAVSNARSTLASADLRDPITALGVLVAADRELDAQLADARELSERRARAEAALERTVASARSRVLSATEFVNAHRGAVGAVARTRLADAEAHLRSAVDLRASDPLAALDAAQRSADLAAEAMQAAERDVHAATAPSGFIGGTSGSRSASEGSGEALIGGLIGGLLSGGGASRPRFGSSGGSGGTSSRRPSTGSTGGSRRASTSRSSGRRGGSGRF